MFRVFIIALCSYLCSAQLPHGHDLKMMIDKGFALLDKNHDGQLTFDELETIVHAEDLNHDGNLTLAEYAGYWHIPPEALAPVFNTYDTDKDGIIPLNHMQAYFHLLDPNGDGVSTLHEYEHYMTGFLQCVYNLHGNHGHGPDCLSG